MRAVKLLWVPVAAVALATSACTVSKEQEGKLPEVDVKGGQVPKYDVDPAKVEVRQDTQAVVVPKVEVTPSNQP